MSIYGLVFIMNLQLNLGLVIMGKPWTPETIDEIYGPSILPGRFIGIIASGMHYLFPEYIGANDFDSELKIIQACSRNWPWMQMECLSRQIHFEVKSKYQYTGNYRWSTELYPRSTPCQDHARAFRDTLECLAHPQIEVGYITVPGHILNSLHIQSDSGETFIYALDNGWDPAILHPYNEAAKVLGRFPDLHRTPIYNETLTCADRRRAIGRSPTIYWFFPGESIYLIPLSAFVSVFVLHELISCSWRVKKCISSPF